ncbi:hypothetical protein J6590_053324 [Homalodisca vitripennis]|nr:hypothetical protein J6590_053324 [Homalodisca vitripennis]
MSTNNAVYVRIEHLNNVGRITVLNVVQGLWGGAAAFIGLKFTSDSTTAMIVLTITIASGAAIYNGFLSNHLDLAPNFAGLLMGISCTFSNSTAIFAPMAAGFIVKDQVIHHR